MAKLTIKDLLEAGVHFGHQRKRWNPKMKEFVYGFKNGISIIDLTKTMRQIADAINFLQRTVQKGGKILFVGTKRQAQQVIREAAEKTGMFYVTDRWLGGTLTNNITIRQSVKKMEKIDAILSSPSVSGMKKKELASLNRQSYRLHRNLDGIYQMTKLPDVLFVVDVTKEYIAVNEAKKLNIPIVAIIDTDGDPEPIDYPITSNDDAVRSIGIIMNVITEAIKEVADIYNKKIEEDTPKEKEDKKVKSAGKEESKTTEDTKPEKSDSAKLESESDSAENENKKEKQGGETRKSPVKKKTTTRKRRQTTKTAKEEREEGRKAGSDSEAKKKSVRKKKTVKKEEVVDDGKQDGVSNNKEKSEDKVDNKDN